VGARFDVESLEGRRVYVADLPVTLANESHEKMDQNEGPTEHTKRNWKFYLLTSADGVVLDVKLDPESDPLVDGLWVPDYSAARRTPEANFLRTLLDDGVEMTKVNAFESMLGRLVAVGKPVTAEQKAALTTEFKGVSNAFPADELAAKLRPLGLEVADFL
jgi:hypothetical protein